jgi:xanthine dehydrogenase YagR molybdenum-binding subunit
LLTIRYYGQIIALVVADSFEQARDAAARVKVDYKEEKLWRNLTGLEWKDSAGSGETQNLVRSKLVTGW